MGMDKVKAIMADVDGTLLCSEGYVTEKTVKAIKQIKEKGILFGLSTGRDAVSCQNLLKEWNIEGLVDCIVGMGGSEIDDMSLGIQKSSFPLDGELIWEIIKHYEDMDLNFCIPKDGILIGYKDDEYIKLLSKLDKLPYEVVDFHELLKTPQGKVMIICNPEYMDKVIERSKTFSNPNYKCASLKTASILYEYMDPRVTKTNGLKEVMNLHGITLDNLLVFGDADNDADMIENAGIGVVMSNGSEKSKSVADFITADNDNDGIAVFLEAHGIVE
ncbi:Cof-type HAD-IIB family hydrolase [Clostridium folliculivorans]|uniref:Sugar phosphate phosphatase n=1 Tax=Clostridium folliculivorans TaxID=2886038 RepID=A0A9W6D8Q6_9CLOT|nr:Cof-type HAD-IIB family hydrolase [Clostridium folliculivorans]GKU23685.1 sugar phosphate phosphatase [Clostridium folliculivorans]GKU29801.1 sugar phosphate phosphatase [Clostridium folliculivorans]